MQLRAALRAVGDAAELAVSPVGLVADEVPSQRAGLAETAHRPWPLPARAWLMGQTWYSLLFAHWAVRPEALRPLIPQPLELDLREGQAWLGVTPFVVGGLRLRGTPPLPWLSRFPELNVRTYVDYGAHPGIYFFSLDAARLAAVAAARRAYRLPYFHAEMSARHQGGKVHYESEADRLERASGPTAGVLRPYGPPAPGRRWVARAVAGGALLPIRGGRAGASAARGHPPSTLAAAARRRHDRAQHDGAAARAGARLRSAAPLQRPARHSDLAARGGMTRT